MGRFPSIGIVHWYNYRFSDLGFHSVVDRGSEGAFVRQ